MNYRASLNVSRIAIYIVLSIVLLLCIVPIWLVLVNSTRSTAEIQSGITLIPSSHLIANWKNLSGRGFSVGRGLFNSLLIAVSGSAVTVYFSLLTAYALEIYNFKLKNFIYVLVLILIMIPMQISIIGYYKYMSILHMLDNYLPLILPGIAAPASIFFAKQYLESCVIKELIEAARIDGYGELAIFNRVMLPIAAPGAFTMAIFAFVASWNNFMTPFMLLSQTRLYTLPMLVKTLRGDVYRTEYGSIYLGLAISIIPVIIVYILFSKYIVSGIAMGAVKE
ncbi:MAG: carbohydrate ABC transporter permease [Oscillospiraceae bacterium]|nr:carbohydrate ABC transporter permease [Oscillospiraceae bacterium]